MKAPTTKFVEDTVKAHWEEFGPINDGLRDIVEPLTRQFGRAVCQELAGSTPEERAAILERTGNSYELPYGRVGQIPPAVFGTITKTVIAQKKRLVIPKKAAEIDGLIIDYRAWVDRVTATKEYEAWNYPSNKTLRQILEATRGKEYPYGDWLASAQAMQRALNIEPHFFMDMHRTNRIYNAALDHDQLVGVAAKHHRPYQTYALVMSKLVATDGRYEGNRDYAQMPVGAYGLAAATKLARVAVHLGDIIKKSSTLDTAVRAKLDPDANNLLAKHTARSRERYADSESHYGVNGVKASLAEGVLTIAQVLAFLTAEKIDGYDDHDTLVKDILETDIVDRFARIVQAAYIGPVTLAGLYQPGALVRRQSQLTLSKNLVSYLSAARKEWTNGRVELWRKHKEDSDAHEQPHMLGLVCPAAAPNGAIQTARMAIKGFYSSL